MSTAKLSSTFLLLLLLCLKYTHSGALKKIKIHVPYYVKHVHHYKKVYVPKIHVIKHEHHHKKEYDHHHHHHEIFKHGPYRSYDKSSHEYPDDHDIFYDDIESKSYRGHGRKRSRPILYRGSSSEQYEGWKDVDGSDYRVEDSGEEDYAAYRKKIYFKRRSDLNNADNPKKQEVDDDEEEEEEEDEEEEQDEEEETEDHATSTSPNIENVISLTTTGRP